MATDVSNEKLTIPATEQPSIVNKGFFQGWFFGSLVGLGAAAVALATGMVGPSLTVDTVSGSIESLADFSKVTASYGSMLATSAIGIASSLIGGLIGGSTEKQKMEKELVSGKEVKEPTFWNKGIFKGLFVADVITTVSMFAGYAPAALGASPGLAAAGILGALGVAVVASGIGFFKGGFDGKAQMKKDYDLALALKEQSKGITQVREHEAGIIVDQPQQGLAFVPGYKNSVSAEEAHALNMRMRQGDPATAAFAQQVEAARAAATEQTNVKG